MVEFLKPTRPTDRCMYPSKRCNNARAHKLNGQLHKLCEQHRQQANRNQKRLQQRRRMQQFHNMQLYVLDTFPQAPEPSDENYNANAYGGPYFPSPSRETNGTTETFVGFYDREKSDEGVSESLGSISPLRHDDDERLRDFTPEDVHILRSLLFDP